MCTTTRERLKHELMLACLFTVVWCLGHLGGVEECGSRLLRVRWFDGPCPRERPDESSGMREKGPTECCTIRYVQRRRVTTAVRDNGCERWTDGHMRMRNTHSLQ